MPCHGCLRARVSGMGWLGLCPAGVGECWEGAGHVGAAREQVGEWHLNKREMVLCCTICQYMALLGF